MRWPRTGSLRPRHGVRVVFGAKRTIRFDTNRSHKRPLWTCLPSCMQTEAAWVIICAGFTTWPWISVGSRGPSSPNEHGPKSEANKKERSLPKNMQQSSLRKKTPNAARTTNYCTKPVPLRRTPQISPLKTSIREMGFSFIAAKSSARLANRVA
jgi:hypothetical protein